MNQPTGAVVPENIALNAMQPTVALSDSYASACGLEMMLL
jgi:hypothetical protein